MKQALLAVVLLFGGAAFGQSTPPVQKPDTVKTEPAPSTSVKPSQDWLDGYNALVSLNDVITSLKKDCGIDKLESKLNTDSQKLIADVPKGFHFNSNTHMFDKNVEPKPEK